MTAPAPGLKNQYHSALSQIRGLEERHLSAATILEGKVAEKMPSGAKQVTDTPLLSEEPSSKKMWPFTDREGNPKIEPLVPVETMAPNRSARCSQSLDT